MAGDSNNFEQYWQELREPKTDKLFYFNPETQGTQWPAPEIPPGWTMQRQTQEDGRVLLYFNHTSTDTSDWRRPPATQSIPKEVHGVHEHATQSIPQVTQQGARTVQQEHQQVVAQPRVGQHGDPITAQHSGNNNERGLHAVHTNAIQGSAQSQPGAQQVFHLADNGINAAAAAQSSREQNTTTTAAAVSDRAGEEPRRVEPRSIVEARRDSQPLPKGWSRRTMSDNGVERVYYENVAIQKTQWTKPAPYC